LAVLLANAASQADDLAGIASFQTYANSTFSTSSTVDALDANLGTATTNITTLQSQVYANANVKTYLSEFDGNIIPSANATFYLGDSTHQWKELWVTGNTIYLGDIPLSMSTSSDATLYVNNQPVVANVTNLIDANIGATTENVTNIDANIGSYQTWANTNITTLDANVGTITTDISTLLANAAAQQDILNTLSGNAVTQETELASLVANAASQATDLTTLLANAATQTGELTTLTANAAAQSGAIDNVNANIGSYQTYANATFASSTDFGDFTLTNNSITTDNGDDGIDLKISGATSDDPPAFVQRTWRFSSLGNIQFLDPFTSTILANGTISTTKIGQWDNTYANLVPSINSNIGAYQAYANATFATSSSLNTLDANVGTVIGTTIPALDANLGTATTNITTLDANIGAFQTYSNAQSYISNVVEDTTPQLGGNLDMNSKSITGSLKIEDGSQERFSSLSSATGNVTHDCANGHVFYHTSISSDFTANFTNLALDSSYATAITLVLVQGGTAYIANSVQIAGSAQTINWQGNTEPTGTANRVDALSFTIINNSGTYTVLGQLTDF